MRLALPLGLFAVLLGACQADAPPSEKHDGKPAPPDLTADHQAQCPPPEQLLVTLDNPPATTCHLTQPFRGTAPGASQVLAQAGGTMASPAAVGADGSFCVELQLQPATVNALKFQAVDRNGCFGVPTSHLVTHQSCPSPDATVGEVNAALHGEVSSNKGADQGQHAWLTDGDPSTKVKYVDGWAAFDADVRIGVKLTMPVLASRVVLRWADKDGDGCDYGKEYKVFLSTQVDPGGLDFDASSWSELVHEPAGDGGEDSHDVGAGAGTVRHLGLQLKNNGCNGWAEGFVLSEVELYGHDPSGPPVPVDSCL